MECSSSFKWWLACMGKGGALACAVLAVAACAPVERRTVVVEPKDVSIAVAKPCIKKEDLPKERPQWPLDQVDLSDPNTELARLANAARLERKVRNEYVGTVEKALEKCSE